MCFCRFAVNKAVKKNTVAEREREHLSATETSRTLTVLVTGARRLSIAFTRR